MFEGFRRRRRRHWEPDPGEQLFNMLCEVLENQETIMADFTKLQAAIDANTAAVAETKTLVESLGADQATIDAAAGSVEANTAALKALQPAPPAPVEPPPA